MAPYNDAHRLFLQAAISRRVIPKDVAESLCERVCTVTSQETDLSALMSSINNRLDKLGFHIRTARNQDTGEESFILVNTEQDVVSQLATNFNATEIAFFKNLTEYIFEQSDWEFSIGALKTFKFAPANFTKSATEALLSRLVKHGWMNRSVNGAYTLSIRSLTELDALIREEYADALVDCHACKEIITRGQRCSNSSCDAALHHHCATRAMARRTQCPKCDAEWSRTNKIGEGAKGTRRVVHTTAHEGTSGGPSAVGTSREQSETIDALSIARTSLSASPSLTPQTQTQTQTAVQGTSSSRKRRRIVDSEDRESEEAGTDAGTEASVTPSPSRRKGKEPRR